MTEFSAKFPSRRGFLAGTGALTAGAMLGLGPARAAGKRKVSLQLGWLGSNGILGEICADEQGYFADAGLELEVIAGGPNIDGVASVAAGRAQMGQLSSSPSLMLARSQGIPVKCIAAGLQQHPYAYFSLEKNPIRTPQDMVGKRIGTQATGKILLSALLAKNGIDPKDVEVQIVGSDMTPLMSGQVDAITGWKTSVGALSVLGDQRVDLTLWDAGIHLYANPYYVTDTSLSEDAETVTATLAAIAKGWGWARENPEKAVDYLVARYPNLSKEAEMQAAPLVLGYAFNGVTAEKGWGAMDMGTWSDQIATYDSLGQFPEGAPRVEDVATLDILSATDADRPKVG
ncbi:nitrate ABC transporter substrate-binding protein [Pseudooceanicola sp. GBMRC 2024]|uniref:Thiamine pyrimidine synthase n=1 Tax=Pseudooceanicola albus TaxID=2692189 RepID=A0A6L7G5N3_9RHOB|nr:ABC transporter substrate-binding protein [Pseudooceanicola albus]MXN17973.1 nitrate ABC transporter substrate-binding protein [Pseudooceanicola albus]